MSSIAALGYASSAGAGKSTQRFAGNVETLRQSTIYGTGKDTALFIERGDISVDTLISQVQAGEHVLLTGAGGSGKSLLLKETFRRLEEQGVPTYPKDVQPTGALLTRGYANLTQFLEANRGQARVVVGLDEVVTGLIFPGNREKLERLQADYPNVRFLATQERFGLDGLQADSDDGRFINGTFGQRHTLAHQNNWYAQLDRALTLAGFTLPESMRRDVESFLQNNFVANNSGIRQYLERLVVGLKADTNRIDSDQPEEIPGALVRKTFSKPLDS